MLNIGHESMAQFKFPKLKSSGSTSKRRTFEPYSIVSFGGGTAHYYGELSPYSQPIASTFQNIRWNLNANYARQFSSHWGFRLGLAWIRVAGDNNKFSTSTVPAYQDDFIRNLHFRNDIKELSTVLTYDFIEGARNFERREKIRPYVFAGVAVFAHDPVALDSAGGKWVRLQPLHTEGQGLPGYNQQPYSLVQIAIPFGFGVKVKLNNRWDISAEIGLRYTFTDYIDDIGGTYANPADLESDLARRMANRSLEQVAAYSGKDRTAGVFKYLVEQRGYPNDPTINPFASSILGFSDKGDVRGNSKYTDTYMTTSIRINYLIPSKIKCPPIR